MEYDVAGQQVDGLDLTDDDVIARWHQRSSAEDFMTGDKVVVKATGVRAMAFAPTSGIQLAGRFSAFSASAGL